MTTDELQGCMEDWVEEHLTDFDDPAEMREKLEEMAERAVRRITD